MSHADPPTAHNMTRFWRVYSIDGGVCNGAKLLVESASNGRVPSVRITPLDIGEWAYGLDVSGEFAAEVFDGPMLRLQGMGSVVVEHGGKSVELRYVDRVEEFRDHIVAACVAAAEAYWADNGNEDD